MAHYCPRRLRRAVRKLAAADLDHRRVGREAATWLVRYGVFSRLPAELYGTAVAHDLALVSNFDPRDVDPLDLASLLARPVPPAARLAEHARYHRRTLLRLGARRVAENVVRLGALRDEEDVELAVATHGISRLDLATMSPELVARGAIRLSPAEMEDLLNRLPACQLDALYCSVEIPLATLFKRQDRAPANRSLRRLRCERTCRDLVRSYPESRVIDHINPAVKSRAEFVRFVADMVQERLPDSFPNLNRFLAQRVSCDSLQRRFGVCFYGLFHGLLPARFRASTAFEEYPRRNVEFVKRHIAVYDALSHEFAASFRQYVQRSERLTLLQAWRIQTASRGTFRRGNAARPPEDPVAAAAVRFSDPCFMRAVMLSDAPASDKKRALLLAANARVVDIGRLRGGATLDALFMYLKMRLFKCKHHLITRNLRARLSTPLCAVDARHAVALADGELQSGGRRFRLMRRDDPGGVEESLCLCLLSEQRGGTGSRLPGDCRMVLAKHPPGGVPPEAFGHDGSCYALAYRPHRSSRRPVTERTLLRGAYDLGALARHGVLSPGVGPAWIPLEGLFTAGGLEVRRPPRALLSSPTAAEAAFADSICGDGLRSARGFVAIERLDYYRHLLDPETSEHELEYFPLAAFFDTIFRYLMNLTLYRLTALGDSARARGFLSSLVAAFFEGFGESVRFVVPKSVDDEFSLFVYEGGVPLRQTYGVFLRVCLIILEILNGTY
ncbi:E2L/OIL-like protein [Nile crocodilepox virus]|uniref:E2L/OIL-like protein n=1 Tax=Nile crocodilepox virus (isolate Crocodylus niloticus/Zimbabwe/Ume/2001) TaxID=1289473 RepID=Q070I9_CPRVZ|nr:E2L/OIL-like protein [Nile crocodilepox virus]ABJ08953.1 E2L/OIL-like protein [Nile crocodilepox virus]